MSKIEVEKLGAVRRATIPVPEDGGVVVLRGQNGSGKSSTLAAVDKMMRRSTDGPTVTDGHDRGTIAGLGVQMSVQRSTRYSGELEVVALDSKLSVADLVDPEIADPRAADAKRMKAILAILKVEPTLDEWIAESADLSHGERSLVACQILINGLGAGGLATLPQEFWEGLDPKNRKAIAKLATDTGVVLITAECSADPELTAEVFSG